RFIRGRPPCLERGQPGCPVTGSTIRDRSRRLSTARTAMTTPPYTVDPLISAKAIAARIEALSREIAAHYHDTDKLVVVGLLRGSFVFIADLVRELHLPVEVDFIEVSSYGNSTESSREVRVMKDLRGEIENRDVLLVEDIVDTGHTLRHVLDFLGTRHPRRIEVCALL